MNIVSKEVVEKTGLRDKPHMQPYNVTCLIKNSIQLPSIVSSNSILELSWSYLV